MSKNGVTVVSLNGNMINSRGNSSDNGGSGENGKDSENNSEDNGVVDSVV